MYNLSAIHNTYRSNTGESPETYDDTLQRTIKSNTSFRLNFPWPHFFTIGSFEHWPEAPGTRNATVTNLARGKEKLSIVPEDFPVFPSYKKSLVKITSQKSQIVEPIQYICAKPWLRPPLRITVLFQADVRHCRNSLSLSSKAYTVSITLTKKKGNEEKRENKGLQQN